MGIFLTLGEMRTAARATARHPLARQVVLDATDGSREPVAIWRGLRAWLAANTRFRFDRDDPIAQQDPSVIEVVHTPLDQLSAIARTGVAYGDCDDAATLAAALTLAAGQRARFVVAGYGGPSAPYRHVYTELLGPGGGLDFDITRTPRSPNPSRIATLEV